MQKFKLSTLKMKRVSYYIFYNIANIAWKLIPCFRKLMLTKLKMTEACTIHFKQFNKQNLLVLN